MAITGGKIRVVGTEGVKIKYGRIILAMNVTVRVKTLL
jgi:hypothetical protein